MKILYAARAVRCAGRVCCRRRAAGHCRCLVTGSVPKMDKIFRREILLSPRQGVRQAQRWTVRYRYARPPRVLVVLTAALRHSHCSFSERAQPGLQVTTPTGMARRRRPSGIAGCASRQALDASRVVTKGSAVWKITNQLRPGAPDHSGRNIRTGRSSPAWFSVIGHRKSAGDSPPAPVFSADLRLHRLFSLGNNNFRGTAAKLSEKAFPGALASADGRRRALTAAKCRCFTC